MSMKQHLSTTIYVVRFADGRIKFGITSNVRRRIHSYAQEAKRNDVTGLVWWSCKPLRSRVHARAIETDLRHSLRAFTIAGHHEWLRGIEFSEVMRIAEELRAVFAPAYREVAGDIAYQGQSGSIDCEVAHA